MLAPGNAGMAALGSCVDVDAADHAAVLALCQAEAIDLVVVGPEGPLVAGLADMLGAHGFAVFGPSAAAARLEGSKAFTKAIAARAGVPTAAYGVFDACDAALAYLVGHRLPVVVKADGLAAGKGVVVAATLDEARAAVERCFTGAYGEAGATVVIEECLVGEEISFFALCDGEHAVPFGAAQDHKRAHDGDRGPNTGGMGAFSPPSGMTAELEAEIMARMIRPTLAAMRDAGAPFRGVLFAGLMLTASGPKLIEYNVRFGDPECQVLMLRLASDVLPLLDAAARGRVGEAPVAWSDDTALTVVMAANGYPGDYATGSRIVLPPDGLVFHAGTTRDADGALIATGGRTLSVSASAASLDAARARAYATVDGIDWPGGFCRRDIGGRGAAPASP